MAPRPGGPSRATMASPASYNHVNGMTTLDSQGDNRQLNFAKLLQEIGYQCNGDKKDLFRHRRQIPGLGQGPAHIITDLSL